MTVNIYQSFYKEEQKQYLDPAFIPYDNTKNEDPDKREYPQMKDVHKNEKIKDDSHIYGLVSWKFQQKSLIQGQKFINFIKDNPGYDCYFINPCFILEAVCQSPWEQGEWHHKGITQMAREALGKEVAPVNVAYPNNKMMFCNFFVGNYTFWSSLFNYIDSFFDVVERNSSLRQKVYAPAGYYNDAKISHFIFLFERLVPTYLMNYTHITSLNYQYTANEVVRKVHNSQFADIQRLSTLKRKSYDFLDLELLNIWRHYRIEFIKKYPNIIGLE